MFTVCFTWSALLIWNIYSFNFLVNHFCKIHNPQKNAFHVISATGQRSLCPNKHFIPSALGTEADFFFVRHKGKTCCVRYKSKTPASCRGRKKDVAQRWGRDFSSTRWPLISCCYKTSAIVTVTGPRFGPPGKRKRGVSSVVWWKKLNLRVQRSQLFDVFTNRFEIIQSSASAFSQGRHASQRLASAIIIHTMKPMINAVQPNTPPAGQ